MKNKSIFLCIIMIVVSQYVFARDAVFYEGFDESTNEIIYMLSLKSECERTSMMISKNDNATGSLFFVFGDYSFQNKDSVQVIIKLSDSEISIEELPVLENGWLYKEDWITFLNRLTWHDELRLWVFNDETKILQQYTFILNDFVQKAYMYDIFYRF